MNANLKPTPEELRAQRELIRQEIEKGLEQLRQGKSSPLSMKDAIAKAIEGSRQGRKVNPLVKPNIH